jgi:hypothetical protein
MSPSPLGRAILCLIIFVGSIIPNEDAVAQCNPASPCSQLNYMGVRYSSFDFSRSGASAECLNRANIIASYFRTKDGLSVAGPVQSEGQSIRIRNISDSQSNANLFILCVDSYNLVTIISEADDSQFMFRILLRAQAYWDEFHMTQPMRCPGIARIKACNPL